MKQTAVEWIEKEIQNNIILVATEKGINLMMTVEDFEKMITKAKAMEKQQIIDAYNSDRDNLLCFTSGKASEQYYNETFKK